jgi:hypothetical protein
MLTLNHVLVGAVAGELVETSPIAFAIGGFVHFLMDKIPHFWPTEKKYKTIMIICDWTLCVLALLFFWFNPIFPKSVFWGGLGGLSIDLVLVGVPWIYHSRLGQWHSKRQPHHTEAIYWIGDFIVIGLCLFILWRFK